MENRDIRAVTVSKRELAKEPVSDKYGMYSSPTGKKACTVRINGQQCWGMQVHGTGCTNPDCPRNNQFGGY